MKGCLWGLRGAGCDLEFVVSLVDLDKLTNAFLRGSVALLLIVFV